jgi:hypothetical protein
VNLDSRHCEERRDAAIQFFLPAFLASFSRAAVAVSKLDCRASLAMAIVLPGLLNPGQLPTRMDEVAILIYCCAPL